MARIIYEPRGRAREYSPLACNLYRGCSHGCKYCFGPSIARTTVAKWSRDAVPRDRVIELLHRDALELSGDSRQVLLCFLCDPYQPIDKEYALTRTALQLLGEHRMRAQVLTKAGTAATRDFDLMKKYRFHFGTTLVFINDGLRAKWEPHAATVEDRIAAIRGAHRRGIYTWVSVEPVIEADQALTVIECLRGAVDFWKIGKLNHMASVEAKTDWARFYRDVTGLLRQIRANFYIKKDLRAFATHPHDTASPSPREGVDKGLSVSSIRAAHAGSPR